MQFGEAISHHLQPHLPQIAICIRNAKSVQSHSIFEMSAAVVRATEPTDIVNVAPDVGLCD